MKAFIAAMKYKRRELGGLLDSERGLPLLCHCDDTNWVSDQTINGEGKQKVNTGQKEWHTRSGVPRLLIGLAGEARRFN